MPEMKTFVINGTKYEVVDETARNSIDGLTPAKIGAAPAGFGLGLASGKFVDDCNKATDFGLYSVNYATVYNPLNAYGALLVLPHNETEKSQILISSYIKGIVIRHETGGVWGEWEWVNPPMALGVEYRTTERWNGKVVYTKLINFGALPNATTGYVYNVIPVSANVIYFKGIAANDGANFVLSTISEYWRLQGYIAVKTTTDYSAYTATFLVKYTKD